MEALTNDIEALTNSDQYKNLQGLTNNFNLLQVFDTAFNENSYSRLLTFLFDSMGQHNLGQSFFRAWVRQLKLASLPSVRSSYTRTYFNWGTRDGRYLDILIEIVNWKSGEVEKVIGIENKLFSSEGENQLSDYQKAIIESYPTSSKNLVYLTPNLLSSKTSNNKLYGDCECVEASYETVRNACGKKYAGINSQIDFLLHVLADFIDDNLIGGNRLESEKRLVTQLLADATHKNTIRVINKHILHEHTIRSFVYEVLLVKLQEQFKSVRLAWHWPTNANSPHEFNFDIDEINTIVPVGLHLKFYYMLLSNVMNPGIGDDLFLYFMAYLRNDTGKRDANADQIVKKILADSRLPASYSKSREWIPWRRIWVGEKYSIRDLKEIDSDSLSGFMIDGIKSTYPIFEKIIKDTFSSGKD